MFYQLGFIKSFSSKFTNLLNSFIYDLRAKHYSHNADLDAIFDDRAQVQNLAFFEVHFHIIL